MKEQVFGVTETRHDIIVLDVEQPYKIPENWIWVSGTAIFLPTENKKPTGDKFDYIDIDAIDNHNQCIKAPKTIEVCKASSRANRGLMQGDTLFSLVRPYLRNIAYVEEKYKNAIASTGFYVCRTNNINKKFLYWLMCSDYVVNGLCRFMKGYNSPSIKKSDVEKFLYPIPPLKEQERIVNRIESLFFKLNMARKKIEVILNSFEQRRVAILYKAFSGELTKEWREKNGININSWNVKFFKDVAAIKSNLVNPMEYPQYPHIAPDNVEKGTGKLFNYNTIAEDGVTSGKHRFYSGQILYSKIRPYLSKVIIVDFDGLCSADMYPIEAREDTKYLWYYMLSEFFLTQVANVSSRSVLPKINQKELSEIIVPMCGIEEQKEIVRILDNIFEKEKKAQELIDVIEKIELMKKTILDQAFHGKLGTNNPKEESAIKLLEAIIDGKKNRVSLIDNKSKKKNVLLKQEKNNMSRTIIEILFESNSLTPEMLKSQTGMKDIDDFYAELKKLVDIGVVVERRDGDESYLEVAYAHR